MDSCIQFVLLALVVAGAIITGVLALCEQLGCGWKETVCDANDAAVWDMPDSMYDLYAVYSCTDDRGQPHKKKLLIESSSNETYLVDLQMRVYVNGSPHACLVNSRPSSSSDNIMLLYEPREKMLNALGFTSIMFIGLLIVAACVETDGCAACLHKITQLRKQAQKQPLLSQKPPALTRIRATAPPAPPAYDAINSDVV
jgi:hypothetical protein